MKLNGYEVELNEVNGTWKMTIKEFLPVTEFAKILAVVREHGGVYSRTDGFTFKEKPDFESEKEVKPESKVKTAKKPKTVKEVEKKEEKKPSKRKEAEPLTKEEVKAVKETAKVEFEVYPTASVEECEEYLNAWKIAMKNRTSEHQEMLDLLIEACKDDEELRQYITHKDYLNVFFKAGSNFCQKNKRVENGVAEASATEILDDIIAEFKKPVKKVTTKKKEDKK